MSWKYAAKRERKSQFDNCCIGIARLVMKWFHSWRSDPADSLCYVRSSRNYLMSIFLVHQVCCLPIRICVSKRAVVFKKQPGPVPLPTRPEPGRFGGVGPWAGAGSSSAHSDVPLLGGSPVGRLWWAGWSPAAL